MISIVLLAFSLEGVANHDLFSSLLAFACVVALALSALLVRRERRFRERAIRPEEAAMLREIDVPNAVLVSMWVVQGWAVTGHDRGAMWIEEGRLVFSGMRTSFALPRAGIVEVTTRRRGPGDFEIVLHRPTAIGPLRVSVATLIGDRPFTTSIERTIANWQEVRAEFDDEGQWPPLALGPDALNSERLRGRWAAERCARALGVTLLGLPVAVAFGIWPLFAGLLTLGLLGSFVHPSFTRTQAIDDRKALEEG